MKTHKIPPCPDALQLSRAFSEGADPPLQAHLAACPSCTREWAAMDRLRRLGRQLPWSASGGAQREAARTSLLASAQLLGPQRRPGTTGRGWAAAAVVAAGLVLGLGLGLKLWPPGATRPRPAPAGLHGIIVARGSARFVHHGPPQDEAVRLSDGTIQVEVSPLRMGERFRVISGDGEVEVRGTRFEVTAASEHLLEVRVAHGLVEVRPAQGAAVLLSAGGRWQAAPDRTAADRTAADRTAPGPRVPEAAPGPPASRRLALPKRPPAGRAAQRPDPPGPVGPAADPAQGPAARAFGEGWKALRAGQYSAAAVAFQQAEAAAEGQPLAEDARYWSAVAGARAGHGAQAIGRLRGFLERYPESPHVGAAAAILGWLLVDSGDPGALGEAERRFRSAAQDRSAEVRGSARAGLAAVGARRRP